MTLYSLEVSLVRALLPIFVKNMTRYVILLHFYVSFLKKKKKKHKNIRSNKIKKKKKKYGETLVSWDFKPHVSNLNFSQSEN